MKNINNSKSKKSKGSVLIAVIGILAVMSVMALRFNVEMETAMIKTAGKNLASDVRVLADSGLRYVIAQILKNGQSCDGVGGVNAGYERAQLEIEEQMEMVNRIPDSNPTIETDIMGTGVPIIAERFNSNNFYGGIKSTNSQGFVPDAINLSPGNLNFLVEDLSGKLPIGHVSQWYQRHLISSVLTKLLTGTVPSNPIGKVYSELFEDTEPSPTFNGYDSYNSRPIFMRSLVPYLTAKSAPNDQKTNAGLPLADGILAVEELGSSYTWHKATNNQASKTVATDFPRGQKDYLLLSNALTPFARFVPETLPGFSDVSYASINPMVMSRQNDALYKSLFYYDPNDLRLKMYFSVSFPPIAGGVDAVGAGAIANDKFFENNIGDKFITTEMPGLTLFATASAPYTYNARNDATDLHPKPAGISTILSILPDTSKSWNDGEFSIAPTKEKAYYQAMDKAVERLSRAFKGNTIHNLPAENAMCPIMTRKTLELAIIQAVFGDSILFVATNSAGQKVFLCDNTGYVDYMLILRAIESGQIDLDKIRFVENAFSRASSSMADKYFVPYWANYNQNIIDVDPAKFGAPDAIATSIVVPAFGLTEVGGEYFNYLPHPQTDQRKLDKCYTTAAVAFSVEKSASVHVNAGTGGKLIKKLYVAGDNNAKAVKDSTDSGDALLDLDDSFYGTIVTVPPTNYVQLLKVDNTPDFKPADFTPYETKIRMAVLVNLLNAIIPAKISPTKNAANPNDTLFETSNTGSIAKSLKEFIYFDNGQYKVNLNNTAVLPTYMSGSFTGEIKTPGMTFWKYGVHSTTFQITVDAFKYDDSTRLSSVVTFDMYSETSTSPVDTTQAHHLHKYKFTNATKVNSVLYLNPLGRAEAEAEKFVIGNGEMRFPTPENTDSWRILSFVWSSAYARSGSKIDEYFVPVLLFPEDVVNKGPAGGSWHFEPHPAEPVPFTKFFMDANGDSNLTFFGPWSNAQDYSTGSLVSRNRCFGNGSWIKWKASFTKSMGANKLDVMLSRKGANANSGYEQTHTIKIKNRATGVSLPDLIFKTKSDWGKQENYVETIPVAVDAGEYDVQLIETKDSNPGNYGNERVTKITIYPN